MGYNSVLLVLNDRLDDIERDTLFGRKVAAAIRAHRNGLDGKPTPGAPEILSAAKVLSVHHADTVVVIAAGGGTGRVMGHGFYRDTDDQLIRKIQAAKLRQEGRKA